MMIGSGSTEIAMSRKRFIRISCGGVMAGVTSLIAGALVCACTASQDEAAATRGFVVTAFAPAIYAGEDACPEGFAEAPDTEAFLAKLPAAERIRLTRPLNRIELVCEAL